MFGFRMGRNIFRIFAYTSFFSEGRDHERKKPREDKLFRSLGEREAKGEGENEGLYGRLQVWVYYFLLCTYNSLSLTFPHF